MRHWIRSLSNISPKSPLREYLVSPFTTYSKKKAPCGIPAAGIFNELINYSRRGPFLKTNNFVRFGASGLSKSCRAQLRSSGLAFFAELWTKQVSYRILVPMSYNSLCAVIPMYPHANVRKEIEIAF